MKITLLEIVQDILSDMDGDLVNSINDTPEAGQIAQIVKRTYYDLINTREWSYFRELDQLESATVSLPTHMAIRASTKKIEDLKYNNKRFGETRNRYESVEYMYPDEFLTMLNNRNTDASNVEIVIDPSGVELAIINNANPQYWTSFDDTIVVMDSYLNTVDTFLQNSKTSLLAYKEPAFTLSDGFIPDFPSEAFTLLIAEAKSRASLALGQEVNEKAEQQSYKARKFLATNNWKAKGGIRYQNYGRKGKK